MSIRHEHIRTILSEKFNVNPEDLTEERIESALVSFKEVDDYLDEDGNIASEYEETPNLNSIIQEKLERSRTRKDEILGFKLNTFKQIEKDLEGLQSGLYLVGGHANTGKTAFIVNLFLDVIGSNDNAYGLYFSLDDNKNIILNRMIASKAKRQINWVDRIGSLKEKEDIKRLNDAYNSILELAENRFNLLDINDSGKISEITNIIESTIKKYPEKKLVVAIDGLHNLDTEQGSESLRSDNIKRANLIKKLVDSYDIPILSTVELRKPERNKVDQTPTLHDINETGKFAYNANVVFTLSTQIKLGEKDPLLNENIIEAIIIDLNYVKNKLSHIRSKRELLFTRAFSHMDENVNETTNKITQSALHA